MSAPRLTHELMLERAGRSLDGSGGFARGWSAVGTLWAALDPRTGRDAGGAAGRLGVMSWRISVRAAPFDAPARPRPGDRLTLGARRFVIEAVAEADPAGRYLTCFATEEVAA
ncbi:head-tail adaptor protein [Roseivivax marinus]|uniref:head-tail adaptor protein n=1 Tax=Roseivivax marinus TaxID=1379903 RepID=UPI00273F1C1A|nr:head-tail adaptor protein [Roseivivax marinus]